jgi:hypothetical protein
MRPDIDDCLTDTAHKDPTCPSGGIDITACAAKYMSRTTETNVTLVDRLSGVGRYLTSSTDPQTNGWSVSSTVGLRQAIDVDTF